MYFIEARKFVRMCKFWQLIKKLKKYSFHTKIWNVQNLKIIISWLLEKKYIQEVEVTKCQYVKKSFMALVISSYVNKMPSFAVSVFVVIMRISVYCLSLITFDRVFTYNPSFVITKHSNSTVVHSWHDPPAQLKMAIANQRKHIKCVISNAN